MFDLFKFLASNSACPPQLQMQEKRVTLRKAPTCRLLATVTSHIIHFPHFHGNNDIPSGRFHHTSITLLSLANGKFARDNKL